MPGFEMLEMSRLRVDQEPRNSSECRSLGDVRHAGDAQGTPERHWTPENAAGEVGETGQ